MLRIQLLSDFTPTLDGTPVTGVSTPRLQSLFAYLVLHRDAPQPRRQLAFLLWPDSSEAQALTNLRKAVHHLRRALPHADNYLLADARTVQLKPNAPFTDDVTEFLTAIAADRLQDAAALYRGDLLPGCYDDWIIPERERLQQNFISALEKLVLQLEAARNYADAISCAQRLLQTDPLREESYRHLMRLHAANDDRAAAMHVYHTCVTTLRRELNVGPSPVTCGMYEGLLHLEARPVPPVQLQASVLPLVGREHEWSLLQAAWRDAGDRPRLVLVTGEAGIGKTRLAEELLEWARRQGLATLTARCYSSEGQLAYAPITEWLRAHATRLRGLDEVWLTEVARLLPELLIEHPTLPRPAPQTEDWQRLRLFKALAQALLLRHSALLLFVDDLQWCDRDTLDWLRYLLQSHFDKTTPVQLAIVGTVRTEETAHTPALKSLRETLARTGQLTEIELGPLTEPATLALANHVAGRALDAALGPLLFQGTEGHPLFVVEMVRAGLPQSEVSVAVHAHARIQSTHTLPLKVRQVIVARLAQLSLPARELVGLAAVVGRAFTFDVLKHASGTDEETLVRGLDELWQRRIVRERGEDAYDFSHDKIREVAYADLSSARRRWLHRQVAEALTTIHADQPGAVAEQIASHYERGGLLEQAVQVYRQAAQTAHELYANQDALRLYEHAINLTAELPRTEERNVTLTQLYESFGDILGRTGQHDLACEAYECALEQASAIVLQTRLYRKLGKLAETRDRYDEALALYHQAEIALGDQPSGTEWWQTWLEVQIERLWAYFYLNAQTESVALVKRVRPIVDKHGTLVQRANFLRCMASLACRRERFVVSHNMLDQARAALELYLRTGDPHGIANGRFSLGFMLLWHGDLDEAETHFRQILALADQTGDAHRRMLSLNYLSIIFRKRGLLKETRHWTEQGLDAARVAQIPWYIALAKANLAWVAWCEGNLAESEFLAHAAIELWQQKSGVVSFLWLASFPLMQIALINGQTEAAIAHARALLDPYMERLPNSLNTLLEQAFHSWKIGEPQAAQVHLERAIAHAQETGYL